MANPRAHFGRDHRAWFGRADPVFDDFSTAFQANAAPLPDVLLTRSPVLVVGEGTANEVTLSAALVEPKGKRLLSIVLVLCRRFVNGRWVAHFARVLRNSVSKRRL